MGRLVVIIGREFQVLSTVIDDRLKNTVARLRGSDLPPWPSIGAVIARMKSYTFQKHSSPDRDAGHLPFQACADADCASTWTPGGLILLAPTEKGRSSVRRLLPSYLILLSSAASLNLKQWSSYNNPSPSPSLPIITLVVCHLLRCAKSSSSP